MTNTVPLRAAAWTVSAVVWSALVILAFTSQLKLPDIQIPGPLGGPKIDVRTEPPPPPPEPTKRSDVAPPRNIPVPDAEPFRIDLPREVPISDPAPSVGPPATGVTAGPPASIITNPQWLSRPGPREFARFYPPRAREREKEGRVTLDCIVAADGAIGCRVARESPEGWGFGQAALKIAPSFRIAPRREDGRATEGGAVRVDIVFRLDS